MIISFSGLDGSGKTTQLHILADMLRKEGIPFSIVEVGRMSIFMYVKSVIQVFSHRTVTNIEGIQFDLSGNTSLFKRFLSIIRQICTVLDIMIFILIFRIPLFFRKRIILCDRYFFDSIAQLYYLKMCSRQMFLFLLMLVPMPDVSFLLNASGQIAYNRKPEYVKSYFIRKSRLYQFIARKYKMKVIENDDIQKTTIAIQKHLHELLII